MLDPSHGCPADPQGVAIFQLMAVGQLVDEVTASWWPRQRPRWVRQEGKKAGDLDGRGRAHSMQSWKLPASLGG